MRFRKGSRVEVLDKKELPSVSWRCGEIISGNGRTYTIMFDRYSLESGATTERVSRKAIRPCPPPVEAQPSWAPGDMVEVLAKGSWKLAKVVRVVGGVSFFVMPLGYSKELMARNSNLRVRQIWRDGRWITFPKETGECRDESINGHSEVKKCILREPRSCTEVKKARWNSRVPDVINAGLENNWPKSSGSMKNRLCQDSPVCDACEGARRKIRAVGKEGDRRQVVMGHPYHLSNKGQI